MKPLLAMTLLACFLVSTTAISDKVRFPEPSGQGKAANAAQVLTGVLNAGGDIPR